MDWGSFFGGIFASLIGVGATVLSTNKIEEIKQKRDVKNHKDIIYNELKDLADECFKSLDIVYDLYAKALVYEKTSNKSLLDEYSVPKPPILIVLNANLEKCFLSLNKQQRQAIRSLLHLASRLENDLSSLEIGMAQNHLDVSSKKLHTIISTFGAIYQVSLLLSEEKERFKTIEKDPNRLMEDTLEVKGISLELTSSIKYVNAEDYGHP